MTWYVITLISAFFVSINDLTRKKVLNKEHALAFLTGSSLIMAVLCIPLFILGKVQPIDISGFVIILSKSLVVSFFFWISTHVLRHMQVSEFAPLTNVSPLVLLMFSMTFLNERITIFQFMGVLLVILGTYILELSDGLLSPLKNIKNNKYIKIFIGSFILLSIAATIDKYALSSGIDVTTFFAYQRIFIAIILFTFSYVLYDGFRDVKKVVKEYPMLTIISSLSFMLADFFYFFALSIPATLVSLVIPVKRTSSLITTIVGGEFFHEERIIKKSLACLIMIFGIVLIIK